MREHALDAFDLERHPSEWSPTRWAFHVWSWLALLVLFVVLELWVDPALASIVVCLKLGWRDAWAAVRLRRHTNPTLARVVGFYCLAQGCFKVAFGSIGLVGFVIALEGLIGVAPRFERFILGLPLLILMLFAGMWFVLCAAGQTVTNRIAGWLDGTLYESLWSHPSQARCAGTYNRVPLLLRIGLLLISCTFLPAPIVAVALLVMKGVPWGFPGGIVFTVFWFLTTRTMYEALKQAAHSPEECWRLRADPAGEDAASLGIPNSPDP